MFFLVVTSVLLVVYTSLCFCSCVGILAEVVGVVLVAGCWCLCLCGF